MLRRDGRVSSLPEWRRLFLVGEWIGPVGMGLIGALSLEAWPSLRCGSQGFVMRWGEEKGREIPVKGKRVRPRSMDWSQGELTVDMNISLGKLEMRLKC